jgi:hypothetical protein
MMQNLLEIDAFAKAVAVATEECWDELTSFHPNERIYGFAICTTDDLAGIWPAATTESAFDSRRDKLVADDKQVEWLNEHNISLRDAILGDCRWSPYEWELPGESMRHYTVPNAMLQSVYDSDRRSGNFRHFTAEVHAATTLGLKRVRDAGTFGCHEPGLTLFCSKHSSCDAVWLERESSRFLNSWELFARFRAERIDLESDEDDRADIATRIFDEVLYLATSGSDLRQHNGYQWWHRLARDLELEENEHLSLGKRVARSDYGPPCRVCGHRLRTHQSKQCHACGEDWH